MVQHGIEFSEYALFKPGNVDRSGLIRELPRRPLNCGDRLQKPSRALQAAQFRETAVAPMGQYRFGISGEIEEGEINGRRSPSRWRPLSNPRRSWSAPIS